jgi:hypothetical protein
MTCAVKRTAVSYPAPLPKSAWQAKSGQSPTELRPVVRADEQGKRGSEKNNPILAVSF